MSVPLVLVHSPLVGPVTWDALAPALRARGQNVLIPDLTGALTAGPPYWPQQVDAVADSANGQKVILAGHSGAGPLLASAGRALDGVAGYLFIDAGFPHPAQSWMDAAPPELVDQLRAMAVNGWLPPWSQWWGAGALEELIPDPGMRDRFAQNCPRLPLAMFEEKHPRIPGWPDAPCSYLRLSDVYQQQVDHAKELGWPVAELSSHHLAVLTDAEAVTGPLLDLVGQLQRRPPPAAGCKAP